MTDEHCVSTARETVGSWRGVLAKTTDGIL